MIYLYLKALHIIAVICWMVGLLYLPRLFVYHAEVSRNSMTYEIFLLMERRLIKLIMLPSLLLTVLFGILIVLKNISIVDESYFYFKLVFVFILLAFHGYLIKLYKQFESKSNIKTPTYFRKINEIPTVLMILIIILVVVKPNLL